jgi:hypothetical protein
VPAETNKHATMEERCFPWREGREGGRQYANAGGMIAYFHTNCAVGTGGSHFVTIDLQLNIERYRGSIDVFVTSRRLCCHPLPLAGYCVRLRVR